MRDQSERIAGSLRGLGRLVAGPLERRQERARRLLLDSSEDVVRIDPEEAPGPLAAQYMAYDPAADLPRVRCPLLAITETQDLQVDPEDVSRIGALVAGPFDGEIPADLTHVLRRQAGPPSLSGYRALLRGPFDAALLDRIASWTAEVSGEGGR